MSGRRLLACYGAWMAVLAVANYAFPDQHIYIWSAIGLSGAAAVILGAFRNRPRRRAPWLLLSGSLIAFIAGDIAYDVLVQVFHQDNPFPSIADVIYIGVYVMMAAGMIGLYRLGVVRRDAASLLDALTLTAGVGLLSWIYLINPYIQSPDLTPLQKAVSVAYPLGDILVLAVGARLLTSARRSPSVLFLAVGMVSLLAADAAYGLSQLSEGWQVGGPVDAGWIIFYALWGAAALHPSMRDLTEPKVVRQGEEDLRRLVLLGLSSLIAPTVLFIEVMSGRVRDGLVIALVSAVLSLLVLLRLGGAVNVYRRSVARERALRQAGAALLLATDVPGVTAVVRDAVERLLPPDRPHRVVLATMDSAARPARPAGPSPGNGDGNDGTGAGPALAMIYTRTLDPQVAAELGDFEVALRCPLASEDRIIGDGRAGALIIAADEVPLVALQEAAQVLATQAAAALERIVLSAEIDRRNSEAYFRTLVLNTADVILIVDEDDRIGYASPSATALFMVPELTGRTLSELVERRSVGEVRRRLEAVRAGEPDNHDRDWRIRQPGDRYALVEVSCRDLRDEPTVAGLVLTLRDVTEGRRLESELYQRATYDSLTGLANREVFLATAREAVDQAAGTGAAVGVLIVELDDFKVVNDTMGHPTGDELLVAVGQRLATTLRSYDAAWSGDRIGPNGVVARLGGDEFAAVVTHARGPADVEGVAADVIDAFREPFVLDHGVVTASASVGVATTTEAADAQDLLRHADLAVYVAKDAGKGRWQRYEASLHTAVVERLKLRSDLDRAIAEGAFLLHYQPIVALDSGATMGFEALVRWNHPTRGMVPPLEFIDLAEESGLIVPLGAWVLRNAIEASLQWRRIQGGENLYISVNVSARQFRAPGFVDQVRAELSRAGLPPESLTLEITESLLLRDDGEAADDLNALRKDGVRIAIDDFGTGFSSLSYLRRLPVDVLKLDKSFIDTIASSQEQFAIVRAIIQLAQILQLTVIAEGIETAVERDLLLAMGCEIGQGYHFARPMSYGDAIQRLLGDSSSSMASSITAA